MKAEVLQNCERWGIWYECLNWKRVMRNWGIEELCWQVEWGGLSLMPQRSSGLLETVMRCPISLTLASISLRAELRAVCIVSETRLWLEDARITTKTNDVMRLCLCRTCHESVKRVTLFGGHEAESRIWMRGPAALRPPLASRNLRESREKHPNTLSKYRSTMCKFSPLSTTENAAYNCDLGRAIEQPAQPAGRPRRAISFFSCG